MVEARYEVQLKRTHEILIEMSKLNGSSRYRF